MSFSYNHSDLTPFSYVLNCANIVQIFIIFALNSTESMDYVKPTCSSQGHYLLAIKSKKHPNGCFFYS